MLEVHRVSGVPPAAHAEKVHPRAHGVIILVQRLATTVAFALE
jgi:hypothetical protein